MFEHDICCTLDLLNRPGVTESKAVGYRTVASGKDIKDFVEVFRIDPVGKLLCSLNIRDFKECVIMHTVSNILFLQLMSEKVVSVHIELQTERGPGRNT